MEAKVSRNLFYLITGNSYVSEKGMPVVSFYETELFTTFEAARARALEIKYFETEVVTQPFRFIPTDYGAVESPYERRLPVKTAICGI